MSGLFPVPAWAGYMLHQASPALYWGTIPGEKEMLRLKSMGVKTLINVRCNPLKSHERLARKLGLNYVHIKTGVVLTPQKSELTRFLSLVCDPANRPAYVFCTLGTDRTCYYVAAYRMAIDGWTVEQAKAELDAHGLKPWWPTFREYDDALKANEHVMQRVAATWQGPAVARTPTDKVDPCITLVGVKKHREPKVVSKARMAMLNVLFKPLEGMFKGSVAIREKHNARHTPASAVAADNEEESPPAPMTSAAAESSSNQQVLHR